MRTKPAERTHYSTQTPGPLHKLTAVEANHAAEVRVGRFLLDPERVIVTHSSQVVIDHLKRTFRRVQPPIERKRGRFDLKKLHHDILNIIVIFYFKQK